MKIFIESAVQCTVDGVGLLEPGIPVEVDPARFKVFHGKLPSQANFPNTVYLWHETTENAEEEADE